MHIQPAASGIENFLASLLKQATSWQVTSKFVDAGESARTDKRPDFQKMISAARAKEFDVILVHKFDRFARNDYDFVVYEKEL